MRKYFIKLFLFILPLLFFVGTINYYKDPGEVFSDHNSEIASLLVKGHNVQKIAIPSDWIDFHISYLKERQSQELPPIAHAFWGSSRISEISYRLMKDKDFHSFILPGSSIVDQVAFISLYEENCKLPDTVTINIDPWAFSPFVEKEIEGKTFYTIGKSKTFQCKKGLNQFYYNSLSKFGIHKDSIPLSEYTENDNLTKLKNKAMAIFSPSYFQSSFRNLLKSSNKVSESDFLPGVFILRKDGGYSLGNWNKNSIITNRYSASLFQKLENNDKFYRQGAESKYFTLLNKMITYLQSKGVIVQLILVPIHPGIYPGKSNGEKTELELAIINLSQQTKVKVIGSFNPWNYPELATNEYYIDLIHVSKEGMSLVTKELE